MVISRVTKSAPVLLTPVTMPGLCQPCRSCQHDAYGGIDSWMACTASGGLS